MHAVSITESASFDQRIYSEYLENFETQILIAASLDWPRAIWLRSI